MPLGVPHSFMIAVDVDGNDIWAGTSKGLGWGIGDGYYPGTKERPLYVYGQPVVESPVIPRAASASLEGPRGDGTGRR